MERLVFTVPQIASDHSIHAIQHAVSGLHGVHMDAGDLAAKQIIVEFDAAKASLDQIQAAMEAAGYPVAAAWAAPAHHHGHSGGEHDGHEEGHGQDGVPSRAEDLVFNVRLLRDGITAAVGYQCACGCKPQARYVKGAAEAGREHCCCGLAHFVGADDASAQLQEYLAQRRADGLDADRIYSLGERKVEAPWGGVLTVAFAVPTK